MYSYMVGTHFEPWRFNYSAMYYHHVHITRDHTSPFFPGRYRGSNSLRGRVFDHHPKYIHGGGKEWGLGKVVGRF